MMRELTSKEIADFESIIDEQLPRLKQFSSRAFSIWLLITTMDDTLRMNILNGSIESLSDAMNSANDAIMMSDIAKYAYKYLLNQIYIDEVQSNDPLGQKLIQWDVYGEYRNILYTYMEYDGIKRAFSAYYDKRLKIFLDNKVYYFKYDDDDRKYDVLDYMLGSSSDENLSLYALLLTWVYIRNSVSDEVLEIARNAQAIDKYKVIYRYEHKIASRLYKYILSIMPEKIDIPENWIFPWGSAREAIKVMIALQIRCLYHLIPFYIESAAFVKEGGGVEDISFVYNERKLYYEISKFCGISQDRIVKILAYFIYGSYGVKTPDPILQPIIRLNKNEIVISPHQMLSSNIERNMLALHARIDEKSFNGISAMFEVDMNSKVVGILDRRKFVYKMNFFIPTKKQAGEVDLVIADSESKTLLCVEMRWMIPPGDAREVSNRVKQAGDKVNQINRKTIAAKQAKKELLSLLGISTNLDDENLWQIEGIVLFDGFSGATIEPDMNIPLVPMKVFKAGIENCEDLEIISKWLKSGKWLPQEDFHFTPTVREITIGEIKMIMDAFMIDGQESNELNAHLIRTLNEFKNLK